MLNEMVGALELVVSGSACMQVGSATSMASIAMNLLEAMVTVEAFWV